MRTRKNEVGAIMVEVLAVLVLLGVMGAFMYRQLQRRNEELDNINMASEIRMVKEATTAYIQANKATLEANCVIGADPYSYIKLDPDSIEPFMPDNWASNRDPVSGKSDKDGIIYEYDIYLTCYKVDSALAGERKAMYGLIIPKEAGNGPMPAEFPLRRAARVAALVGSDGGVRDASDKDTLMGTMGAWEVDCPPIAGCAGRDDDFYVATTGMDIYIPETENTADNTVAVPHNIAFGQLHSTEYFSVGKGRNCVGNTTGTDADYTFAHETLDGGKAKDDTIKHVGIDGCDPLFWVGNAVGGDDKSAGDQVYVKHNVYIGRENSTNRQAVAIETGDTNDKRQIIVFDTDGNSRLTLNGEGKIVGRVDSSGKGYKLDAENGEIVLFKEANFSIPASSSGGSVSGKIQVPTLRMKEGRVETGTIARYKNESGTTVSDEPYAVDPAGTSLMKDIRLTSRGGAKLSDILPNYISKEMQTVVTNGDVKKPTCPKGYAAAISVTPVQYSQYVKSADLQLNLKGSTNSASTTSHSHSVNVNGRANTVITNVNNTSNTLLVNGAVDGGTASLKLTQMKPVQISINGNVSGKTKYWVVGLTYGGETDDLATNPITALAQTYCVFDEATFGSKTTAASGIGWDRQEAEDSGIIDGVKSCTAATEATDCSIEEKCVDDKCTPFGTCTESDGTSLGGHLYCYGKKQIWVECFTESECTGGKTCVSNKCTSGS